jgi:hypothetical protein
MKYLITLNKLDMKTLSTIILILLFSVSGIKAQKPIVVSGDSLAAGKSKMPSISVTIPEADYEKTLKVWIKELQSGTKSKVVNENSELTIFGAVIKEISATPINVYSKLMNQDSILRLVAAFELKKDLYINNVTTLAEYAKAQKYLKEFAKDQYIDVAKDQLDAEDKILSKLQKELSSMENDITRLQKSIQSNNSTITREKEDIVVQKTEYATASAALLEQNAELSTMTPGPAQKEKMNSIKELEKREKKALNSIESSEKKISKANMEIEDASNEIPRNKVSQEKLRDQIAQQDAVVQKYSDKLAKIKLY